MLMGVRRAEVRWQDWKKETNREEDNKTDKGLGMLLYRKRTGGQTELCRPRKGRRSDDGLFYSKMNDFEMKHQFNYLKLNHS